MERAMTETAIVILNWNGEQFLKQFLPILIRYSQLPGVEIIIADNGSTDNSVAMLQQEFNETRVIQLDKNYGFAGGYNKALEEVDATYFLLLNSDIEVKENWLPPLISFMKTHCKVAACSPVLLDYNYRNKYEYAGAAGGYIDRFGYTFCRGRIFNTLETATAIPEKPLSVFWTTGAAMLVRSDIFRQAGGFDENFFAHMEEVDLCWRLKNMGYLLAVVPASRVYHVGGGTLPSSNPFKTYLNFRNNLLLLYKNLPEDRLRNIIRKRMLLDGLSAIRFLATFQTGDFRAVIKAHGEFRKMKTNYREHRHENRIVERSLNHPEIYQGSVVADYFLAGKKHFKELRGGFSEEMDKPVIKERGHKPGLDEQAGHEADLDEQAGHKRGRA
jgi:GT2 family glycosyltransferase